MSTQSILTKDIQTLSDNADNVLMCMGDKYLLNKKYGVGSGYDRKDFKKIMWLDRLLCEKHCALDCLTDKLKEKLNLLTLKYI